MNFKPPTTNYQPPTGFTLVETLIAVTILTLAVSGPLYTASRAIVSAQMSRDQLIASYLSQEGIEYVRAVRDNEFLSAYQTGGASVSSVAWTNFLNRISQCRTASCTFDPAGSGTLSQCSGQACTPLYLAPSNIYTQQSSSGTVTPFTRSIRATDVTASDEKITSTVSWNFHGVLHSVTVTNHITPWQ